MAASGCCIRPKTSACRRFEQVTACFRIHMSCPKHLPAHALRSFKGRPAFGSSPLRGPAGAASSRFHSSHASPGAERSEVDPGLLVLNPSLGVWNSCFFWGGVGTAEFFRLLILQNTLQADVLGGFQRKRDFTETHLEKRLKLSAGRRFGYKHPTRRVGIF